MEQMKKLWNQLKPWIRAYRRLLIAALTVVAVLFVALIIVVPSFNKKTSIDTSAYKIIDAVPGCSFSMNKEIVDESTAIMEISKQIDFIDYETYQYKNGEDLYLCYNMRQYIFAVKKGTEFHFSEERMENSLADHNMQGIWFRPMEKASVKKRNGCYVVDVSAEVTITPTLYNDFYGQLITFEKEGEEWSMFVGYVRNAKESTIEMVEYVAKTFTFSENTASAPKEMVAFNMEDENAVAEKVEEKKEVESPSEKEDSNTGTLSSDEETLTAKSTIQKVDYDEGKAYSSSIYSMLSAKGIGFLEILNEDTGAMEPAYIKINRIIKDADAEQILSDQGIDVEVPQNCHAEIVEYDIRYTSQSKSYINICLRGLDGEKLRHRGVAYSSKTYDLPKSDAMENDWYLNNMVYYFVPDGCNTYALECSGIIKSEQYSTAWYCIDSRIDKN